MNFKESIYLLFIVFVFYIFYILIKNKKEGFFDSHNAYHIKAYSNNKFCSHEHNKIRCNKNNIDKNDEFTINNIGKNLYSIKSKKSNKFCSNEIKKNICNRPKVGKWEKYYINNLNGNKYSIKSRRNKRFCSLKNGILKCDSTKVGNDETFIIETNHPTPNLHFGQWELLLKQTYNGGGTSLFIDSSNLNMDSTYNKNGNISMDNYYNKDLLNSSYKWNNTYQFKLSSYIDKDNTEPNNIRWSQSDITNSVPDNFILYSDNTYQFMGLITNEPNSVYIQLKRDKNEPDSNVLGASQAYFDNSLNTVSNIPGYLYMDENGNLQVQSVQKVELYIWNPHPKNINTYNNNFSDLKISKVDMLDTKNDKRYWDKVNNKSKAFDNENQYSYCFGNLKCSNIDEKPTISRQDQNNQNIYKPYCNSDNTNNPVYCEGSILFNTNNDPVHPVNINDCNDTNKSVQLNIMGKYADETNNGEYFNLFRGLTTPYNSSQKDPVLEDNYLNIYDSSGNKIKSHICNFLDNVNMDNGTNIQKECFNYFPNDKCSAKPPGPNPPGPNPPGPNPPGPNPPGPNPPGPNPHGKQCIINYGHTKMDEKYYNYICPPNEICMGYQCGKTFGNCQPKTI